MDKVKISRNQASSIEFLTENYHNRNIVIDHAKSDNSWKWEADAINGMDIEILIAALYVGYEVEESPEDKVKAQYESPKHFYNKNDDTYTDVYRKGIKFTLDTFNIKIEGIN